MRLPLIVALALTVAACGSTPPEDRYYSLVLEAADDGVVETNGNAAITVALGRIDLPAFLDTRAMALQTGQNEIELAQHHFWAEPLDEAIGKVLVRDITESTMNIDIVRSAQVDADCELSVEFDRFHATDDTRVLSSGRYWLASANGSARRDA